MRTPIITLMLILIFQLSIAQNKAHQIDTLTKKKTSAKQNLLFIKFHSVTGFGIVKPKVALYNFGSMAGTGAEFILGFKLQPKAGLGFGIQRSHYFLNQTKIEEGLKKTYTQPLLSVAVSDVGKSSLQQAAFFVYLSGWKQKDKNIFEYYTKMSLNSFQYHLNSRVNRTSGSNYNISTSYDGGLINTGFLTVVGFNYSRRISKIFYVGGGMEYGLNLSPKTILYENNSYSNGTSSSYQVQLPTPAHLLQGKIGVMFRPKKACNCKESKPW